MPLLSNVAIQRFYSLLLLFTYIFNFVTFC